MTRSLCIFASVDSQQLREMQPSVRERSFRKGELLTDEGEVSPSVYVVKVGIAFWRRRGFGDASRPIGIAGRGATFGVSGFFGQANHWSGLSLSTGRLCEVPVGTLKAFAARHPQIAERLAAHAMAANGLIASWSAGMRVNGVVRQLAYAALLLADTQRTNVIELPTQHGLAELLGTTRETVVRAMAVLEKSGALRHIERRKFEVSWAELTERLNPSDASPAPPGDPPT